MHTATLWAFYRSGIYCTPPLAVHSHEFVSTIITDKFSHSSKHSFSVLDLFSAIKVSISFELYKFIMVQWLQKFSVILSRLFSCFVYSFCFSISFGRILCISPWIYQTIMIPNYECSNCHTLDISQEPMPPYNSTPCQFQWIHVHNRYIYIYIFLCP